MDIPAALNLFLKDPTFTRNLIKTKVEQLTSAWNKKFYQTDATVILLTAIFNFFFLFIHLFINLFIYYCFLSFRPKTRDRTIQIILQSPLTFSSKRETMLSDPTPLKLYCASIIGIL